MEKMEKHVEAIVLDDGDAEDINAEQLSKMSNLRLLIINDGWLITGGLSCLSKKLRYVKWNEYPFKYLPSSFHPNELVKLNLRCSNIKQLWKNKKYLPNLRRLDLCNSKELENIIDFGEFPNLEWLCLEGCERLVELDPSIGLLRKLVYLNVKDCKNLVSIPNNILDLSSLKYLNMCGCSKVFNNSRILLSESVLKSRNTFLLPSLHRLYCLREVDISFCNLSQVPDSIECLCSLERLKLGGNDFVTLPSLRKLSKLVYLNLQHCKLLESLPQLPSPTTVGRERDVNDWISGFVIFNCPKLGERECYSSMAFSWMLQFIKANQQSFSYPLYFKKFQIVTPGSEIPSWINNQSMGDSIRTDRSPIMHDNNNNFIGFVCCALFTMTPNREFLPWTANMVLVLDSIYSIRVPVIINGSLITTKSSHLWIFYFPRESNYRFVKFSFKIVEIEGLGMEVKSCGYRWVCKQDLQEFNLTMNHKNSLTRKRKILAIEDETQPQP